MHAINLGEVVFLWRREFRQRPVTAALFLAAATASSVYCQTPTRPDDPVVAEAGGWRLAVTRPIPGDTTSSRTLFCYDASGTGREHELALEITPMRRGGGAAADAVRTAISVGRSSVTADLSRAGEGTFDLRVQLVVDGSSVERPAVLVREVTLRHNVPQGTCS